MGIVLRPAEGRTRRGQLADRLAVLCMAAALYLVVALTGPGAYVLADGAADALHEVHGTDHSPVQFAQAGGEHHNPDHSPASKRLKGALEPTSKNTKALGVLVSHEVPEVRAEYADSTYEPILVEGKLQQLTLPPQLLQRPPPEH